MTNKLRTHRKTIRKNRGTTLKYFGNIRVKPRQIANFPYALTPVITRFTPSTLLLKEPQPILYAFHNKLLSLPDYFLFTEHKQSSFISVMYFKKQKKIIFLFTWF